MTQKAQSFPARTSSSATWKRARSATSKQEARELISRSFLPLGRYTITASGPGFSKVAQENIEITLNQTRVVNFTLNPSSVTEAVVVTSDAAPINTTNAEIKGSLNAQEILEKPTFNQGSFLTLAETFTGFQENPTSGQNNPTASSGSSINFNGTGTRGATFQINGVNNDDSSENQNRQGASLSTIKEFQVITNNFTRGVWSWLWRGCPGPNKIGHEQSSRRRLLVSQRQCFERRYQRLIARREERRHASQPVWIYLGISGAQRSSFSVSSVSITSRTRERTLSTATCLR